MSAPISSRIERLEAWRRRGQMLDVAGNQIFVVDTGPRDSNSGDTPSGNPALRDQPPWLILHGFPTASYDFHRVIDHLSATRRVVVHDHLGFGFSAKPTDAAYSLFEQTDLALGVWRALGIEHGHVLAHDYGTSIATELAARVNRQVVPFGMDSLTLSNGSVLIDLARLRPAQRLLRSRLLGPLFARAMTGARAQRALSRLWFDPSRADAQDLEAMWQCIANAEGHKRMPTIIQYLDERRRFRGRWLEALHHLARPAHILWGRDDPVAVPAIAERLAAAMPAARLSWIEGSGHYPMLETPDVWAERALQFVEDLEA